jgi:aspartate/methionine/tyrosine aminotransferase
MKHVLNEILLNMDLSGIRRFSEEANQVEGVVRLTIGEPMFDTPLPIKQAAIDALVANDTHYPFAQGLLSLRKACCEFEKKTQDLDYVPSEVIITQGATGGLFTAINTICQPNDEVIILLPAFTIYKPIVEFADAIPVLIDISEDDFQISEEKLRSVITARTKAIIVNSPNNPSGISLSRQSNDILEKVVKEHDLYVLCDDVYNQLIFEETDFLVRRKSIRKNIIYIQSFSKPYAMTGWRIGYVMADQPVATEIAKVQSYGTSGVPPFVQQAAITALTTDVSDMMKQYENNMIQVSELLTKRGIPFVKPQGAFYLLVDISQCSMDSWTFARKLLHTEKVAVIPGEVFGAQMDRYVRTSLATDIKISLPAFEKIANFILNSRQTVEE